jgi:hypothetical protein
MSAPQVPEARAVVAASDAMTSPTNANNQWRPDRNEIDAALASLAKAWPVLAEHATHIDGEFNNALTDVRRMFDALTDDSAALDYIQSGHTVSCYPHTEYGRVFAVGEFHSPHVRAAIAEAIHSEANGA